MTHDPAPGGASLPNAELAAIAAGEARARALLRELGRVVVAFSGGVDSSVLLALAVDELGAEASPAALAVGPSLPAAEERQARDLARWLGARLVTVDPGEIDDPRYRANRGDRCYWCRAALVEALAPLAARERATPVYGAIVDDLGDDRPGMEAARRGGFRAPLLEAGLDKRAVRAIARRLELPVWDKPPAACLASRIPAGTPVTAERLSRVERAEEALREMGLRVLRVRDHDAVARLELGEGEIARLVDPRFRSEVVRRVQSAGYERVAVDLEGYRSPAGD